MNVLRPNPAVASDYSGANPKDILAELDQLFADGWEDNTQRIADLMGALQSNCTLLRDWVMDVISKSSLPELSGAQSFLIHKSNHMLVRINLWFESGRSGETVPEYRRYLSIDELHNHNFEFFTIRLLGSGYVTDYYRDEGWTPGKREGDPVELGEPTAHKLHGNDVHLVERLYDYHSVSWPERFSVSLNVMPLTQPKEEQYIVDAKDRTVKFVISPQEVEQVE